MLAVARLGLDERLRRYVRTFLEDAERGTKSALAKDLDRPRSWLSMYIDQPPQRHADLDDTLGILRFLGLTLEQLIGGRLPTLTRDDVQIRKIWRELPERVRAEGRRQLASLQRLAQVQDGAESSAHNPVGLQESGRKTRGKRRGA